MELRSSRQYVKKFKQAREEIHTSAGRNKVIVQEREESKKFKQVREKFINCGKKFKKAREKIHARAE